MIINREAFTYKLLLLLFFRIFPNPQYLIKIGDNFYSVIIDSTNFYIKLSPYLNLILKLSTF